MTDNDHESMAELLQQVKGKVLLSGYHSKLYDRLFGDWQRVEKAAFADGALKRTEVLWMNFEPEGLLL
jgi:DNA adenine methylase